MRPPWIFEQSNRANLCSSLPNSHSPHTLLIHPSPLRRHPQPPLSLPLYPLNPLLLPPRSHCTRRMALPLRGPHGRGPPVHHGLLCEWHISASSQMSTLHCEAASSCIMCQKLLSAIFTMRPPRRHPLIHPLRSSCSPTSNAVGPSAHHLLLRSWRADPTHRLHQPH